MSKQTIITIIAFVLCAASLLTANMYRNERRRLMTKLEETTAQLDTARQEAAKAGEKDANTARQLKESAEKLESAQKDLKTAEEYISQQKAKWSSHTAVCDFEVIAATMNKVKKIGPKNLQKFAVADIVNFIAHSKPVKSEEGKAAALTYDGSCYLPGGRVTKINDIAIENEAEVLASLKNGASVTIQVEMENEQPKAP